MRKHLQRLAALSALALFVLAPAALATQEGEEMKAETTLVGQLSQDAAGAYVLVEQESGDQILLEGSGDALAKHVGAKVKVTGEWGDEMEGKKVFRVSKVEPAA